MSETAIELDRLKSAFLAIISHELRTPLTEIITAASILDGRYVGELTDEQQHYLDVIRHSAEHLNDLIRDLLAFSQLEAEVTQILREPTGLNELVGAALDFHRSRIDSKRISISLELDPGLPPIAVDRGKILRVLSNLISNAVNFTGEGGTIRIGTERADGELLVRIADSGSGIPKEKQPHIFDSFYQADDPLVREIGGLGIGLAYARRIVEAHGGRISFESTEGVGSVFSVALPEQPDGPGAGGK
jgi:signal transduction histidine kinase